MLPIQLRLNLFIVVHSRAHSDELRYCSSYESTKDLPTSTFIVLVCAQPGTNSLKAQHISSYLTLPAAQTVNARRERHTSAFTFKVKLLEFLLGQKINLIHIKSCVVAVRVYVRAAN